MGISKFEDVCVKDRILLHLSRFKNTEIGQEYNVPFDITQDGIGMVVGISRAHASLSLKQLIDKGMVVCWQAHMKGQKGKRLVYGIASNGAEKVQEIEKELAKAGITTEALLDMKNCNPEVKWNSLSEEDRDTFGKACTIRVAIPRSELPDTRTGIIPTDMNGKTCIQRYTAEAFLKNATEEQRRNWHSWAADWWIGSDDPQERLYHLIAAGRNLEACRLAVRCSFIFLSNPNEDTLSLLEQLKTNEKFEGDILWIRCEAAVAMRRFEYAKKLCDRLGQYDEKRKSTVLAQIAFANKEYKKAYQYAEMADSMMPDLLSSVIMAHCFLRLGNVETAEEIVKELYMSTKGTYHGYDVDLIFELKAKIAYIRNDRKGCMAELTKAWQTAPPFRKAAYQIAMDALECGKEVIFPFLENSVSLKGIDV
ncbi:MAG: hypothetical protein MJZ68_06635 [archaeon]|nr:hypothetical protein [archaeon]